MHFCREEKYGPLVQIFSKYLKFRPHFTQKVAHEGIFFLLHI